MICSSCLNFLPCKRNPFKKRCLWSYANHKDRCKHFEGVNVVASIVACKCGHLPRDHRANKPKPCMKCSCKQYEIAREVKGIGFFRVIAALSKSSGVSSLT